MKGTRDFDKLIKHRELTDKIVHNPIPIDEIEEVLNELQMEMFEKQKFREQEEIRDEYYKLLNDV